jgi:uncharacterized protein YdhG (YjbR/CyaY superfamily)
VDQALAEYVAAIPSDFRPLFDRIHRILLEVCPDAIVSLSYNMPTYKVGKRRLHVGVWKHGISIYGWKAHGDGGFTARHPDLQTSTGTIQLRPENAAAIPDDEFRGLVLAALAR